MSKKLQGSASISQDGCEHQADGPVVVTYDHLDSQTVTFHVGDASFSIIGVDALIAKLSGQGV